MKTPWKATGTLEADTEYLVLASSIPPKSMRSTWKMFRGAMVVRKQLLGTDGVLGFATMAEPLERRYATLSIWRDEAALDAFAAAHPHDELMAGLAPEMGPTRFVRWTITGADQRPTWDEALSRLA